MLLYHQPRSLFGKTMKFIPGLRSAVLASILLERGVQPSLPLIRSEAECFRHTLPWQCENNHVGTYLASYITYSP